MLLKRFRLMLDLSAALAGHLAADDAGLMNDPVST
jgi:hypothetical protein